MANQEQQRLMRESGYSPTAIRYFLGREHAGQLPEATTAVAYRGPCGDILEFMLKIREGQIVTVRFQAIGCAASFASGEALARLVEEHSLEEVEDVTEQDVLDHLGGLPEEKLHCAKLAIRTFRRALYNYLLEAEAQKRSIG